MFLETSKNIEIRSLKIGTVQWSVVVLLHYDSHAVEPLRLNGKLFLLL